MVIATQNTLYSSGTFPLPEPQLDRFLMSVTMVLPDTATQSKILALHASGGRKGVEDGAVMSADQLLAMQDASRAVPVSAAVCDYITALCEGARRQRGALQGISARAAIALMRAAQAVAFIEGHNAVYPDDVKRIASPVLAHRLGGGDRVGGNAMSSEALVEEVLRTTAVP
jgi:MoxR-like ATPase